MEFAKQIGRARYIAAEPGNFLRLLHAMAMNRWLSLTAGLGEPRESCVLCGWSGRSFNYFLERRHVRKNAQCPRCGSMDRNRKLAELLAASGALSGRAVLEVSPPRASAGFFEKLGADYFSIDYGPRQVSAQMDLVRTAFKDRSFDVIVCSHVLEHILDIEGALGEMRRLLKRNGVAYVDVPFAFGRTSRVNAAPDHQGHWHDFGHDVADIIEAGGFKVQRVLYDPGKGPERSDNILFACVPSKPLRPKRQGAADAPVKKESRP